MKKTRVKSPRMAMQEARGRFYRLVSNMTMEMRKSRYVDADTIARQVIAAITDIRHLDKRLPIAEIRKRAAKDPEFATAVKKLLASGAE